MSSFDTMLNVSAVKESPADGKLSFAEESKANRNLCYEMSNDMTESVSSDGNVFREYLNIQSRFDRYTANNALLIMAQKPDARKLGDYGYWRDQGYYVKRQEKASPILIMEPGKEYTREDGSVGTYYNAKKLYDITQTTWREKVQPQVNRDESQLIRALVSSPPVNIIPTEPDQMPDGRGALFIPEESCIYVKKGMDASDIFRSLTPELILADIAGGDKAFDRGSHTFYAYCATYIVCEKYGVDTKAFNFDRVPEMFEGMELPEIRGELNRIRESAGEVIGKMHRALDQNRSRAQEQER